MIISVVVVIIDVGVVGVLTIVRACQRTGAVRATPFVRPSVWASAMPPRRVFLARQLAVRARALYWAYLYFWVVCGLLFFFDLFYFYSWGARVSFFSVRCWWAGWAGGCWPAALVCVLSPHSRYPILR